MSFVWVSYCLSVSLFFFVSSECLSVISECLSVSSDCLSVSPECLSCLHGECLSVSAW